MATLNEKQISMLEDKNFAAIATIDGKGGPQVNPMWVGWDGTHIVMNTAVGRAKEKQLARDPRVAVSVWNAANPYEHFSVTGTAKLTLDGAEAQIDAFAKKYMGEDVYPWRGPTEKRITILISVDTIHAQMT